MFYTLRFSLARGFVYNVFLNQFGAQLLINTMNELNDFASIILNACSLYLRLRHLGATVHLPSIQVITFVPSSTNPGSHAYCTVFPVSRPCPLVTWGIGGHGPVKQMYDI